MHVRKPGRESVRQVGLPLLAAWAIALSSSIGAAQSEKEAPQSADGKKMHFVGKSHGRVEPSAIHDLTVKVDGVVNRILFKPGQHVARGDLLVELDASEMVYEVQSAKAAVTRARAQLSQAKDDLSLYERLKRRDVTSRVKLRDARIKFETATADVLAAEASFGKAQLNLKRHKLHAPIRGRITRARVHEGAAVESKFGKSLIATISKIDPVLVRYSIPYDVIAKSLRLGRTQKEIIGGFTFRLILPDGIPYKQLGTTVAETFEFDAKARLFYAFAEFSNPQGLLQPGLEVTVEAWSQPN